MLASLLESSSTTTTASSRIMTHVPSAFPSRYTRILLFGPQSTGKTTLAREVNRTWTSKTSSPPPALIEEVARKAMAKEGFSRDDVATNVDFQRAILLSQLSAESQTPLPYITDRCIIDPLTYTLVNFGREKMDELRLLPGVETLLEEYRTSSTLLILFEPVSEFWHDDGARKQVEDEKEWWDLLRTFEEVFQSVGIKSWKRLGSSTKDLEERVDLVQSWIAEGPGSP